MRQYNFSDVGYEGGGDAMHSVSHTHDGSSHTHDFSDDHDYSQDNARGIGAAGTRVPVAPGTLRTPQPTIPNGGGMPLTVRGARSPNLGLANQGGRAIGLARRMPVRQAADVVVTRLPGGSSLVRHRQGGGEVGQMKRNSDGTWQAVVDSQELTPRTHQRTALLDMLGAYNLTTTTPDRAPVMPPPQQTPLMQQFGVPAIRLASGPDGDGDDDGMDGGMTDGLTPRGKQIYKKLCGKGMAPKVAMAMAKRSQNGPPGRAAS